MSRMRSAPTGLAEWTRGFACGHTFSVAIQFTRNVPLRWQRHIGRADPVPTFGSGARVVQPEFHGVRSSHHSVATPPLILIELVMPWQ